MSSPRDVSTRLRQTLNPLLTTSLSSSYGHAHTPQSAVSGASPFPYSGAHTPASSIQPYNPQEWIPSPAPGPEQGQQYGSSAAAQGSQGSPLPPPPYSPPRGQRPSSVVYDSPPANMSAARVPASNIHRPSPEPQNAQNFPPPPGSGGRGPSRERRFGLPSLGRRREREANETASPPEPHPPVSLSRPQPAPPRPALRPIERAETEPVLPPAARRAASASAIDLPPSERARSDSRSRWAPGMPVPPPPPGPPPAQVHSRSQSLNRTTEPVTSPPTRRPPPEGVSALGPVPPTPANWEEEEHHRRVRVASSSSQIQDTTETGESTAQPAAEPDGNQSPGMSPGLLNRTGAVRGEKTLRERRTESRISHSRAESSSEVQPLSNIVVPQGSNLNRSLSVRRNTPRSAGARMQQGLAGENADSRHATPRPSSGLHLETPTPPFSPRPPQKVQSARDSLSSAMAPKSLPTPPPQSRSASSSSQVRPEPSSADIPVATPLSAALSTKQAVISQTADQFCAASMERYRIFALKEAAAKSDAERVKLFADFVVSESRLRRERYSAAIAAMGSEMFDLTRDLFRPMNPPRRDSSVSQGSEWTPQTSELSSHRNSFGSTALDKQQPVSSAPASATFSNSPGIPPATNPNWNSQQYMPSLSPILSMSVSEAFDSSSRGRPASRWWEADSNGEGNRMERSKRESKYMGVPKEAREALQWEDASGEGGDHQVGSSQRYSAHEYPPEKVGWHEPEPSSSTPQQAYYHQNHQQQRPGPSSTPNTPGPLTLDISRLVTLPPPYPRHHPAVNNNHPELSSIRVQVRTLSDMTELTSTKEEFAQSSRDARTEASKAAGERRRALRVNLQQEISSANMSYAEAAAIEHDMEESEKGQARDLDKKDFERFQAAVVMPLNELLMIRIAQATSLFDELQSRLFATGQDGDEPGRGGSGGDPVFNPNMPQEEGDEQPELLEKLTLLKWIFEAREHLHREIYDLLSDRNNRYKEMVLTPYRAAVAASSPHASSPGSSNTSSSASEEKLRGAQAFFAEDARKRAAAFAADVLRRTREFRDVVESNVARGVDMQLNAFWDIAPPLRRLLDKIPAEELPIAGGGRAGGQGHGPRWDQEVGRGEDEQPFRRIHIPPAELDENPAYHDHPLQYLYSLLLHAEKSTYQFIESQTNLQCLLHEVKEAVAGARARASEAEAEAAGGGSGGGGAEQLRAVDEARRREAAALTDDLKEKVRVVEDQWDGALGDAMRRVKEAVRERLLSTGGWDESLEDGGVGSA